LTVVCLHLKAKPDQAAKRADQISYILSNIKSHLNIKSLKDSDQHPLLICGDFNGDPFEKFFEIIANDKEINLANSYADSIDSNGKPQSTTFKIRASTGLVSRTIDYIFYSKSNLSRVDYLQLPSENEIDNLIALPSLSYPSDHISLVCDFQFN
jgi:nocturnin